MRVSHSKNWTTAIVVALFGASAAFGCKAAVSFSTGTEPPPPAPAPADDDGDGIPNPDDKCPSEMEDGHPPEPGDGCPALDSDGDGVADYLDKCPDQAGTGADGCPEPPPVAEVKGSTIQINKEINFKKGSAEIEGDSSMEVIDAVAAILEKNPQIQMVEIEGHASKEGDEFYNKTLTGQRVKAVQAALVAKKVDAARLVSTGYGFYCPKNDGTDEAAHAANRRVEFKIVYVDGKRTEEKLGCEAAEKKGVKPTIPAKPAWTAPAAAADAAPAATPPTGGGIKSTGK